MAENFTQQNRSLLSFVPAQWDFSSVSDIFGFSIGTLSNATVLFLLLFFRIRFSAFGVYLINVLIGNIYYDLPGPLLMFFIKISPVARDSPTCCTLHLYTHFTSMAVVISTHLLITLSRLWAAVLPLSYRNRHTTKVAVALCVGAWLFGFSMASAFVILDAVHYRLPIAKMAGRCFVDTRSLYNILTVCVVLYLIFPMIVILMTFPIVWFKCRHILQRSIKANRSIAPFDSCRTGASRTSRTRPSTDGAPVKREQNTPFIVYFILTISTILFRTPITIAYTMRLFLLTPVVNIYLFMQIAFFLLYFQTVIDPVLLVCFHREWRNKFRGGLG